jgi:hypothetical protein
MKKIIASFIALSLSIGALSLIAEPTPTPSPTVRPQKVIRQPVLKPSPTPASSPAATVKLPPRIKPSPSITQFKASPTPKIPKPTATPTINPSKIPKASPTATINPLKIPNATPSPTVQNRGPRPPRRPSPSPTITPLNTPGKTSPTPTATTGPIKIPGKTSPTPTPTVGPIKIPGKTSPTPTATTAPIKIPGKTSPTPTATISKILIPGKKTTPTPTPTKILIPGKKATPTPTPWKKDKKHKDAHIWININVMPPPPTLLGPPIYEGHPPVRHSIPKSAPHFMDDGYVPVPETYTPPPAEAPVEESPTQLRAWNGQDDDATRAFDQTRVKVVTGEDQTMSWQFYWKTTGPAAQAARWEVATVPFIAGVTTFPPAGLVGYGDASVDAESPLSENFFAIDFNSFSANFEEGSRPNKYYMRVVPVDLEGNVVGKPSNFIRVDLP